MQANDTLTRRQVLTPESLRALVNIELNVHTECHGVRIRRIIVIEPDAWGCNWQAEWPALRAAAMEPCRSQLHGVIERCGSAITSSSKMFAPASRRRRPSYTQIGPTPIPARAILIELIGHRRRRRRCREGAERNPNQVRHLHRLPAR